MGTGLLSLRTQGFEPLAFIRDAGAPALVQGIQTGMIEPSVAVEAFAHVREVVHEQIQVDRRTHGASSYHPLEQLRNMIDAFKGTSESELLEVRYKCILRQLLDHSGAVENAVRDFTIRGAAIIYGAAPYDLGAEWRWIPPGPFLMGSSHDDFYAAENEMPLRAIIIGGFYMLDHTPANAEFEAFLAAAGRRDERALEDEVYEGYRQPHQPAINVDHEEASTHSAWYGMQLAKRFGQPFIGRLPTEAEWEKAAKGPNSGEFIIPATHRQAHFGAKLPRPVNDSHAYANGYGLKDMIGNVGEWTSTRDKDLPSSYVVRGGAHHLSEPHYLRATQRSVYRPTERWSFVGYRPVVVLEVPDK